MSSITTIRSRVYRVPSSWPRTLAGGGNGGYARVALAVLPPPFRVPAPLETVLQDALGPQYRLARELEAGGMSRLFLATDVRLKRDVVVKVLPPDLVSEASTSRFKREIELTVRLQHPHILPILTSGEFEDGLFYITPYIQGESLRARIEREGKLPLDDILRILKDVSGALAFAHQRGIVHRDIKPGNILLSDGHAILADFGIARAVSTTATPLTESGVAPGTPAYMAPELPTDERADVYALGVVAYEMLTAGLPSVAPSPKEILLARGAIAGDTRTHLSALAGVTSKGLSRSAAERPASAREFRDLLDVDRTNRARLLVSAAAAVALLGGVGAVWKAIRPSAAALSDTRYSVVSLKRDSTNIAAIQDIALGFSAWRGPVVSGLDVDAPNGSPERLPDIFKAARRIGVRHVIVVDAVRDRDSLTIQATAYDAAGDSAVRSRRISFAISATGQARRNGARILVNGLLRDADELPWRDSRDSTPVSLAAWRHYDVGRTAIAQWQLRSAEDEFQNAIRQDSRFALAHLWLAQVIVWRDMRRREEFRLEAQHAVDLAAQLRPRDSVWAAAIAALATGNFESGRVEFRRLVSQDPSDAVGWIGLADCESLDRAVLRDRRTLTGWAFRGSFEHAARAYRRAAEQVGPAADAGFRGWALGRLSGVLFTGTNRVRQGEVLGPAKRIYGSFPFLDHDTLAFAPHPVEDFGLRIGDPSQASIQAAVSRNRNILRSVAEEWVRRSPQDPAAYDSLATLTELSGGLATLDGRQTPTLEVLHRARVLTTDSLEQARLAIAETRVLFKDRRFREARGKADSLMRSGAKRFNRDVSGFVGLAALLGHVGEAEELLPLAHGDHGIRLGDGTRWDPPKAVIDAASNLSIHSAFGTSPDSVHAWARRVVEVVGIYVPDSSQAVRVRTTIAGRALVNLIPDQITEPTYGFDSADEVVRVAMRLAQGHDQDAKTRLMRLRAVERGKAPGNEIRSGFPVALMWLALSDTLEATRALDVPLNALPALDRAFLDDVNDVGLLIRGMALRADLAERVGDTVTARTHASAVATLWADGDASIQPVVNRMRRIVSRMR